MVDYKNVSDLASFVKDNIKLINDSIKEFKKEIKKNDLCKFDETDIKNYLKDKLVKELPDVSESLLNDFKNVDYKKNKLAEIANKNVFYKKDLEAYFETVFFAELFESVPNNLDDSISKMIADSSTIEEEKKKYVSASLKNIISKVTILAKQNGFSNNLENIESGVQTSNAGDSSQFLFISRAILAGFNCSNVDVRTSRYDAVIDYNGIVYKVQVKGISGKTVSFKDRDRGGRGIDTHNERNQGKRITSKDCDIYVAVDKQVGICYIIPIKDIENELTKNNYNVNDLVKYRENWEAIHEIYNSDPRSKYTSEEIMKTMEDFTKNGKKNTNK